MSPTQTLQTAAAEALVGLLPTPVPLQVRAVDAIPAGRSAGAVVGSFVGSTSADLAVVMTDTSAVRAAAGTDTPLVAAADVLRPALEAASAVLGSGVLGDTRIDDASAVFADPETVLFELSDNGIEAGWFGIRVRANGAIGNSVRPLNDSVVGKLGRISNVEMSLTVEIGRTRMSVRDVLALEPGAVIELDRSAGAPADVLLNGRLIAHGEIVVIDQDYAVRITQILDVAEGLS
ncbi:flagellar motor switch protein FliN [Cryobacterium tepidiphilum]|uniref:Flagellar motor switch protein FliN n=1 Tax=Cryobacterium tepidiphilum TaxID=2486026 RepID=A0A3M8LMG1_9MICO|nr:flagellar motor switch protein FliN [Cryobacterium tepidiphilum]RNE66670.1 flagellar motor switch protein FliN [Cryobacterium tepidiphilum]